VSPGDFIWAILDEARRRSAWHQALAHMEIGDPREEISRLETRIDDLADAIARCRKIILFAKAAMAIGGLLIVVTLFGLVTFDPTLLIGGMTAVIGGIVLFGSNTRTLSDFTAAAAAAEKRRNELIGIIDLRVVRGADAD
jgi:hypothetical protein